MGQRRQRYRDQDRPDFDERIIDIKRVAKVVKGGRRFAFRVVVVVGDNRGSIGYGIGKARSVPDAIRKAIDAGRKNMEPVSMVGNTIPHEIVGRHSAARVLLKPAAPGTGVIAGGAVRAVIEAAGYRDILSKSLGSANVLNIVAATINGLRRLKVVEQEAADRGKDPNEVAPFWNRNYG